MSELDQYLNWHPEWPQIEAYRLYVLAQLALKAALAVHPEQMTIEEEIHEENL